MRKALVRKEMTMVEPASQDAGFFDFPLPKRITILKNKRQEATKGDISRTGAK